MRIRVAVPVKDEEVLLPFFLRHYASFCDSIVVWDNGSSDRTTELAAAHPLVELRRFQTDGHDQLAILAAMEETRRESVGRFDWLLFPDCDEFVVSRSPGRERAAIEAATSDVLVPDGYCLVQGPDEPPLSPSRDLLEQRRFGYPSPTYSKPIILRPSAKAVLHAGKHSATVDPGCRVDRAPDLLLVHGDMIDFDLWVQRKMRRLSESDIRNGWCVRRWNRLPEEYDRLWDEGVAMSHDLDKELPPCLTR